MQHGLDIEEEDDIGFGRSVSLSADGNVVAIGAPGHNSFAGVVRVYEYDGIWKQFGIDILGDNPGDTFGHVVSLSADGKTLCVGAPQIVTVEQIGFVKIFTLVDN